MYMYKCKHNLHCGQENNMPSKGAEWMNSHRIWWKIGNSLILDKILIFQLKKTRPVIRYVEIHVLA